MNDSQDNPETPTTPTESEGRKPQFSIGKMLFWTAVARTLGRARQYCLGDYGFPHTIC